MVQNETTTLWGNVVDILSRTIYGAEVTIEGGRISRIRRTGKTGKKKTSYLLPGFIDAHVHNESSMSTPAAFAQTAVQHGTVGVVADPHEMANVLGVAGIYYMIDNVKDLPFYAWTGLPSCVPSTGLEGTTTVIDSVQTANLLKRDDIHFLSEVMNFPCVIQRESEVMKKIQAAKDAGKPIDGHAPMITGEDLKAYIAAGISTDHEAISIEDGREKCAAGLHILIREGSAAKNFHALHPLLKEYPEQIMFCTDDIHPSDLLKGHINLSVKRALALGYDLYDVLRAASYNPARHYHIPVGFLREGDSADFVQVNSLEDMHIEATYIKGVCVYDGKDTCGFPEVTATPNIINNFHALPVSPADLAVKAETSRIRVITCQEGELITGEEIHEASVWGGFVQSDTSRDIVKLVVVNRYYPAPPSVAFIKGTGIKHGAVAQSIMHDNHNLIAVGVNDENIVEALNAVIKAKGGIAVSSPHKETCLFPLPIAGLISPLPVRCIAEKYERLERDIKALGTPLQSFQMTLSFMGLIVIPSIKLSDKGLFDTNAFSFTNLFV
ncbi:Adenine deaminase [Bacteroidales bacterium Barb7]|nr:Adenine deaminase [Bacteroidales bacterium Barb7]